VMEPEPGGLPTGPVMVIAGADAPAARAVDRVQVALATEQVQPEPVAEVLVNGSGMDTVIGPELALVPFVFLTVTVSEPALPATNGTPASAVVTVRSTALVEVIGVVVDALSSALFPSPW